MAGRGSLGWGRSRQHSQAEVDTALDIADRTQVDARGRRRLTGPATVRLVKVEARRPPTIGWPARVLMGFLYAVTKLYKRCDATLQVLAALLVPPLWNWDQDLGAEPPADEGPDGSAGLILTREDAPSLFRMLRQLTKWMGVQPDEVRLSHLPVCGVIDLGSGRKARRRVLILGLPCFQVWTIGEVLSVLGHELAHLKLEDAAFTREVLELGTRLQAQADRVEGWIGQFNPRVVLARATSSLLIRLATPVSRSMEYRADRWSADCFGADHLASALEKLAIMQPLFGEVLAAFEGEGSARRNVYQFFDRAWDRLPLEQYSSLRRRLVSDRRTDRTDPHPPVADRLARLRTQDPAPRKSRTKAIELLADPNRFLVVLHNHLFEADSLDRGLRAELGP